MDSARARILSYGFFVFGAVLTPFSFVTGSGTDAYCEFGTGISGWVYETFGVYPPAYEMTINWSRLLVVWNDGCNARTQSLWFSILGLTVLVAGAAVYYRGSE